MNPVSTLFHCMRWQKAACTFLFFLIIYGNNASAQCWKLVESGNTYGLAIKDDGTLWGWGFNTGGQLGLGSNISQSAPVQIGTGSDWASVSAANHTMAIKTNGTLWSWGSNFTGALGTGGASQASPVQVGTASNWATVSAGGNHTVAIRTDGSLWAWGLNSSGQLGLGNNTLQNSPVQVGTATDWKLVTTGSAHTLAIKTDGSLWAWGANTNGCLGIGNTTNSNLPVQVGTATDWAAVTAGNGFTVALKTNGTMWAWGTNSSGQLGIGNTTHQNIPIQIGTDADWSTIGAGIGFSLALKTGGTLWAWGLNSTGQLGIGNTTQQNSPVQVETSTDWIGIAGGSAHSIGLRAGKTLWAWGQNTNSQLGVGNTTQQNSPVLSGSSNHLLYVPALGGGAATLVLPAVCNRPSVDGYFHFLDPASSVRKLATIHPGNNSGNFTVVYDTSRNTNTTPLLQTNTVAATSLMGRLSTITYSSTLTTGIRVRYYYSSADSINTSNSVNSWISAQIGATQKQWQWIQYEGDATAMAAAQTANGFSGSYRVLSPDSSGVENGTRFVEFWNLTTTGTFGAIALASTYNNIPTQCWKAIETGWRHTAAIKTDGTLWAWGVNSYGQLGTGNNTTVNSPVQVGTGNNWATVAVGYNHTMAIKTDGTLWASGYNTEGQLGIGNTTHSNGLVQVGTDADWTFVAAGQDHSVAVKTDGSVWAWGRNNYGQLGIGNNIQQLTPVRVGTATDWKTVSAGASHTMALKTDGTIWGWGYNAQGQLGNGNTANQTSPVQVGVGTDWNTVSAGIYSTMAIKTDGTLWAWGRNTHGELGLGTSNHSQINPVQVGTATNWAAVSTGSYHSLGIKTDGTLWTWGYNNNGELGFGNYTEQLSPVQVATANNWASISAGWFYYTIALNNDGAIWAAGDNTGGQLGIGNYAQQTTIIAGGAINYPAYLPGLGGGSGTLVQPCGTDIKGYYQFVHPSVPSKKLFAIHPNGNAGSFTVVYDTSRNTNSSPLLQSDLSGATSIMGRLVTVTYSGTIGAGMRVRFHYNSTDSTNASNALDSWMSTTPGSVKQWQWIKYEGDAAAMVANQSASGFTGTYTRLSADSSGIEDGVSFVEFWNINSFSSFGGMAIASINSTLPTSLTNFTATLRDNCNAVTLEWTTDLEQNSKNFIIQRSATGNNWSDIGSVTATGNSTGTKKYSYSDATVKGGGIYYYRLQTNDLDGRQKNSKILTVKLSCSPDKYLIYPNPVKTMMTIQSPTGGIQRVLTAYNGAGQRILELVLHPGSVQTLNTSGWKQGIYMVIVSEKGKPIHTKKIIKL